MSCNSILDCYVNISTKINELLVDDVVVAVVDGKTKTYASYVPGETLDHGVRTGDEVPEETLVYQALSEKKRVVSTVDSQRFGFPYVGVAIPVEDENREIVGSVSISKSLENQEKVYNMATDLSEAVNRIVDAIETISAESEELASTGSELTQHADELDNKVEETDEILKVVQGVTDQTNLLGLNAAIEAARLGQEGRGFGVVAEEIRKLADDSKNSLKKIEELLKSLKESDDNVNQNVTNLEKIANEQANEIQSISQAIGEIESKSSELAEFAKHLY